MSGLNIYTKHFLNVLVDLFQVSHYHLAVPKDMKEVASIRPTKSPTSIPSFNTVFYNVFI